MRGIQLFKRLREALTYDHRQATYAQSGEDVIVRQLFYLLGIANPTYLDVGAHHPTYLSNTYLFYQNGGRGVCIEPNPGLLAAIQRVRPRDTCLNIGIGFGTGGKLRFFVLDDPTLSTFSEDIVREQVAIGRSVTRELDIPLESINRVIEKHLLPHPNLVSLDTEGLDLTILESLDFDTYRPEVFCIETLTNVSGQKISAIFEFMAAKNYTVFADTHINTIFVEGTLWKAKHASIFRSAP